MTAKREKQNEAKRVFMTEYRETDVNQKPYPGE
jgi:hypothetical protein